jgi:hypothetical protein
LTYFCIKYYVKISGEIITKRFEYLILLVSLIIRLGHVLNMYFKYNAYYNSFKYLADYNII